MGRDAFSELAKYCEWCPDRSRDLLLLWENWDSRSFDSSGDNPIKGFWLYFIPWWPWIGLFVLTSTLSTHLNAKKTPNEWSKWLTLIKSCVWCRVCGTFLMVKQNRMHYGWEILVLVFIQQPMFRPQTGCSLFDIAITEVQCPTPPSVGRPLQTERSVEEHS